ncbi:hypothetical protein SAMN04487891_10655 [Flagellimonas taeanensis]|uniref:Uncharacterized protein n=1 Tax=Flagellimonas taeanensis TaxID=1005926 RepID=A0A1M6Z3Y9_9FLAO|nr:hypothetical protein [Allomuricauda taeanensis]SFC11823.1 hypothetical protein SAMN04487891_10655 [Allomuricauda taeanensis]SHL25256.1 hypothetical protein SAMN05216293_3065 [Allomuricauda taeanensis]
MIQKIWKNFKLTLVLFITGAILLWVIEGYDSMESAIVEYWWVLLVLPFVLRFYNWFTNLKQKAFDYGADTSGAQAERSAAKKDTKDNTSEQQYAEMLGSATYTKVEAENIRNRKNYESLALQKSISEASDNYTIPLHRYVSGLPGPNLLRPSELKQQYTVAQIKDGNLEFHHSSPQEHEKNTPLKNKFSQIPLASILELEVVDLAEGRELKRVGADMGRRMAQTIVSAASQTGGAKVGKANVDASKLIIHYVNEDGIVMPATFVYNSNSKFGVKAMENIRLLNKTLKNYSFLGRIQWNSEVVENTDAALEMSNDATDNEEDSFEISEITALLGDMNKVLKWANMLSPHDSAVVTAKLSAEMLAGVIQDPSVKLTKTIQ